MGIYSYEVDNISKDEWHKLLSGFSDALVEQTWSYAASRWRRGTLSHLIVKQDQDIVVAVQVVILSLPLIDSGIAFIKFGPLWQQHDKPLNPENLRQAVAFLHQEYVVNRGCFLRIMPSALHIGASEASNVLLSSGFKRNQLSHPDRYLVDLSPPLEEIRKSLKPRWRSKLKKAEKRDLEIIQLTGDEALNLFMPLYEKMLKRKSFADDSAISEFPEILQDLPSDLRPIGWFCMHREQCVGGVIISAIGDTALYWFGATDEQGLEVGAGFFLHWKVIDWLREQGVKWYDLGGHGGDAGLRQFKSGLIGKGGVIVPLPGNFEQCSRVSSLIMAKLAFGLKDFSASVRKLLSKIT